jgi:predicted dienelactone hydrolase
MTDRVHDVSAVLDALPTWFGERVDMTRVGIMGHSRGSVTALAVAGGSTTWGFPPEPRVKALMGTSIGAPAVTFAVDLQNITIPALLLAGTLDTTSPPEISRAAFEMLASTDKELVLIENAVHCHFCSAVCAQTQSAGGIASASTRAILDLHTIRRNVTPPSFGVSMDFCGFETFTHPSDIRPLVASLTGFEVTPNNVPTTGVDSAEVDEDVVELAVAFFGRVLRSR